MKQHARKPQVVIPISKRDDLMLHYLRVALLPFISSWRRGNSIIAKSYMDSTIGYQPSGIFVAHKPPKYCVRCGGVAVKEFGKSKRDAKAFRNKMNGSLDGGPYHISTP